MPEKTLSFTLPPEIANFLTPGQYGLNVTVDRGGYVKVRGRDRDYVEKLTDQFLRPVVKGHGTLSLAATRSTEAEPPLATGGRARPFYTEKVWITVTSANPAIVFSRAVIEPAVYCR